MRLITLALLLTATLLLIGGVVYAKGREQIICNPNEVIALHERESIYPAWKYVCAEGYDIIILD